MKAEIENLVKHMRKRADELESALAARCDQPAGEPVPLPEPVAKRSTTLDGRVLCEPVYTADQLREYAETVAAPLREKLAELERKTLCMMGVGDGSGQLFVYGDYYAIKAAQAIVIRAETAEREREADRRDAERYRWLRISATISWNGYVEWDCLSGGDGEREAMDAAIDSAMGDSIEGRGDG